MGNKSNDLIDNPASGKEKLDKATKEAAKLYYDCFNSPTGKKVLDMLSMRFFSQECFTGDNPNPFVAAKRDGNREVMRFIYENISRGKNV